MSVPERNKPLEFWIYDAAHFIWGVFDYELNRIAEKVTHAKESSHLHRFSDKSGEGVNALHGSLVWENRHLEEPQFCNNQSKLRTFDRVVATTQSGGAIPNTKLPCGATSFWWLTE